QNAFCRASRGSRKSNSCLRLINISCLWYLMPPPGGPRSPFQCLLDASQARIQSGVRCQQRRDLFLLSLDPLLLLFDGVDEHDVQAVVLDAFDLAFVVVRDQQGFYLRDAFGPESEVTRAVRFPSETNRAQAIKNLHPFPERC